MTSKTLAQWLLCVGLVPSGLAQLPQGDGEARRIVPLEPLPLEKAVASPSPMPSPEPAPEARALTRSPNSAPELSPTAIKILEGARLSLLRGPRYDASFVSLSYPWGDPGWDRGCGADLIVRAFRAAGVDLQAAVHEAVVADPETYRIREPNRHIDHRRLRPLQIFFKQEAKGLELQELEVARPGDVVFWSKSPREFADHVGIVSDRRGPSGHFQVIFHLPADKPKEEDAFTRWPVQGIYRWAGEP